MKSQREILGENLRKLIKSKGIDQKILADHLNTSEMSVSNWVSGTKYPRIGNIQKMADYFGVRKSDLIEDKNKEYFPTFTSYNFFPAPISAGMPIGVEGITNDSVEKISIPDSIMGKYSGRDDIFFTRIYGDSMNNIMPDGTLIAVKPVEFSELKNDDIVVYSYDGEYAVKHYFKDNDEIAFIPDSKDRRFREFTININDCLDLKIKGKVVLYIVELD